MSTSGGNKAIVAAPLANLGIAITKFLAWFFSGSASMLAEGVHSLADTGNQLLLLRGGKAARKAADKEHPFGYGRERYVYAFVVSIILFSVGGVFSVYEGVEKLQHPHELENALPGQVLLVDCASPRAAQNALANLPEIAAMAQIGASLRVLGDDGVDLQTRIAASLRAAGVDARVETTRPNLEDVFVAATRQAPAARMETRA